MRTLVVMLLFAWLTAGDAMAPVDRFERTGPQPGEWLPDLPVTHLDGQMTSLRRETQGMTLLVTSSFTCPKSRSRYESLKALAERFREHLRVVLVYVIEAHPIVDVCPYKDVVEVTPENQRDGILFRQPTTMEERLSLARGFRDRLSITLPIVMDRMENRAWTAFGAAPHLALLVDSTGKVLVRQGWYDGAAMEGRLREIFAARRSAQDQRQTSQKVFYDDDDDGTLERYFGRGDPRGLIQLAKKPDLVRYQTTAFGAPTRSLLQIAADGGHHTHVAALLKAGANVNAHTEESSALHLAARAGHLAVVDLLLTAGADRDLRSSDGTSALDEAAFAGHTAIIERLLPMPAPTPLLVAAVRGQVEVLRSVITDDASRAYLSDGRGRNLLMYACANGQIAVVELLLRAGVDPHGNLQASCGTPLHAASERGQVAVIRALLAADVDPHAAAYALGTPLLCAARYARQEAVAVLLDAGALMTVYDRRGYAPIHYAAEQGNLPLVELLLKQGADPRLGTQAKHGGGGEMARPASLDTPLHLATRGRHVAVMRLLLAQPVGVHTVFNHAGQSALFALTRWSEEPEPDLPLSAALDLLLAASIDLNLEDRKGHTVLDRALANENKELTGLLRAYGARTGSGVDSTKAPR